MYELIVNIICYCVRKACLQGTIRLQHIVYLIIIALLLRPNLMKAISKYSNARVAETICSDLLFIIAVLL